MSVEDIPPSLSPEEAELLAAKITPSWEAPPMDEETATDIVVPSVHNTPLVPPPHAETEPKLVAAAIRREAGADVPPVDGNSDFPTQRGKDASKLEAELKQHLEATAAATEETADATVRMPSITDGLSDGDIVAADPIAVPGPPRAPTPSGPPPRKAPAPTANMIPYVPEGDRSATTARIRGVEDDEIPESSVRGSNKGLVIAVVALVAVLAFGGVFFALRTSGASAETAPTGQSGMVQPPSSKGGDVPAPEALPERPMAAGTASAEPKKAPPAATPASSPQQAASPSPPQKPSPAVAPPPHAAAGPKPGGGGSSGGGTAVKPPPAAGKPGGIVRDNPF
ncbi:MAG: hypothetical protein U0174_07810 [Polyangiaceae bacterium]